MSDMQASDEEWTELFDADVPQADLVGHGANGFGGFLVAKQAEGAPGLFDPAYVRGLIAKSEPTVQPQEAVTLSGSPAAVAELIRSVHGAPVRKSDADEYREFVKAKYNTADRKRMAGNGQAMDDGSYPIADREDLTRAIRAVGRGGAGHDAIRRHIISRARSLGASSEIPDSWNSDGSLKKADGMAMDDGIDGMDPTVPLAAPDTDAPGDPNEPGSPAWEAIDAATAHKWLSIATRLKNALCVLAEREMLEAATADPDDAEHALDLQDAMCAVDYAIEQLAVFAASEQAEAELGAEMEAVGKALAGFDVAPLEVIEGLAPLAKSGRVLSAANEAAIRGAVESLQKVLASLPAAPTATEDGGRPVAKTANEEPEMDAPTPASEVADQAGQAPAMGSKPVEPKPVAGTAVTDVEKADGDKPQMVAVFDANGKLVGIVDPGKITPVAGAEKTTTEPDGDQHADMDGDDDGAAAAEQDTALTPVPQAQVGTPADAVGDGVAKQQDTTPDAVLKGIAEDVVKAHLGDYSAAHERALAKLAAADVVKALEDRVKALEEQEAVSKVFANGAVPPPQHLRGQDRGTGLAPVDTSAALMQKQALYGARDAAEQNQVALDMQQTAIALLEDIHARRR